MKKITSIESAIQNLHENVKSLVAESSKQRHRQELEKLFLRTHELLAESIKVGSMLSGLNCISFWKAIDLERGKLCMLGNDISHRL